MDKFRGNCAAILASEQVEPLREATFGLPEAASVAELTRLLMPGKQAAKFVGGASIAKLRVDATASREGERQR